MAPIQRDDVGDDHPPPPTPNDPHPYVPAGVLRVRVAPTRRGGRGRAVRGRDRRAIGRARGVRGRRGRRGRGVRGRRGRGVRDRPRGGEPLRPRRRLVNDSSSSEEEFNIDGVDSSTHEGGGGNHSTSDNSESDESGSASDVCDKCGSTDHITPDCFLKKNTPVQCLYSDGVWWDADIILVHRSVLGGYKVRYHDDEGCIESNVPVPANRIRRRD